MKFSETKKIKQFCETLHSNPDWRDVVKNIENLESDFEIDNVRFINDDNILAILAEELAADTYILGCFISWMIADATDWPIELIEACQENQQYEIIGNRMDEEQIKRLAEMYAQHDGYGHHFNHYDFSEEELFINGEHYHVFDNR